MALNVVQSVHESKTERDRNMVPRKNVQDILDGTHEKRRHLQENKNKHFSCTKNQTRGVGNKKKII